MRLTHLPTHLDDIVSARSLADDLCDELRAHPHQTARRLATALGISKTEVNRTLYARDDLFASRGASPPRWHVLSEEGDLSGSGSEQIESVDLQLYSWQLEALAAWRGAGHRGVVEAVTGAGKTRVAVAAIQESLSEGFAALVIVPTVILIEQWCDRLREQLGIEARRLGGGDKAVPTGGEVLVATVHSAARRQFDPRQYGRLLLVADEVHRYGAPTFAKALAPPYERRLGLTATYERNDDGLEKLLKPYFGGEPVYTLGYVRALADDVIAPFRIAVVEVDLNSIDQLAYDEAAEIAARRRTYLIQQCGVPARPFGEFMAHVAELAHGSGRLDSTMAARSFLSAFTEMRRITAENDAKQHAISELAATVERSTRSLVFSTTIEGASLAASALRKWGLGIGVIASNLSREEREAVLRNFESGRLDAVAAPLVLDEGVDVPEADLGIVVAGSKTRRQMIQRLGRVVRRKPNGEHAKFVLIVCRGTNEDPASGAHADFLDEMLAAADQVRVFETKELGDIDGYLFDGTDGGHPLRQHSLPAAAQRPASTSPGTGAPNRPLSTRTPDAAVEVMARQILARRGPLPIGALSSAMKRDIGSTRPLLRSSALVERDGRWHLP